jgi:rare lipoprotein A
MDTPAALLTVLKRKLGGAATVLAKPALPALAAIDPDGDALPVMPAEKPVTAKPEPVKPAPAQPAPAKPARDTQQSVAATKGQFVQVGAFSSEANARKAASAVSAEVSKAGKFWVVRLGPLASKADTDAALAKARAAGYGDAVVRRIN